MEDFLDHGYGTVSLLAARCTSHHLCFQLFEAEINRKVRSNPALAIELEMEAGAPAQGDSVIPTKSLGEEARATEMWFLSFGSLVIIESQISSIHQKRRQHCIPGRFAGFWQTPLSARVDAAEARYSDSEALE